MKDVIEQISQIDKVAFEDEQKNKAILDKEESRYESEIQNYQDRQLSAAYSAADITYSQMLTSAQNESAVMKADFAQKVDQMKAKFSKNEKKVIKEIFEELFVSAKGR